MPTEIRVSATVPDGKNAAAKQIPAATSPSRLRRSNMRAVWSALQLHTTASAVATHG